MHNNFITIRFYIFCINVIILVVAKKPIVFLATLKKHVFNETHVAFVYQAFEGTKTMYFKKKTQTFENKTMDF